MSKKTNKFPLADWFNISRRIEHDQMVDAAATMVRYALRDGIHPDGPEVRQAIRQMKNAVRKHNKTFPVR